MQLYCNRTYNLTIALAITLLPIMVTVVKLRETDDITLQLTYDMQMSQWRFTISTINIHNNS